MALQPATHSFWLAILICLYVASAFILFCFVVLFGFVVIASAIVLPHSSSLCTAPSMWLHRQLWLLATIDIFLALIVWPLWLPISP